MKTPKRKKAQPVAPVIVWTFNDGTKGSLTLEEYETQRQEEMARMLASADARIRLKGKQRLEQAAAATARHRIGEIRASARNAKSAKAPRPARVDPVRNKIVAEMHGIKASGKSFREFMQSWRIVKIDGISLKELSAGSGRFQVDDENMTKQSTRKYTRATLQKLYSKS